MANKKVIYIKKKIQTQPKGSVNAMKSEIAQIHFDQNTFNKAKCFRGIPPSFIRNFYLMECDFILGCSEFNDRKYLCELWWVLASGTRFCHALSISLYDMPSLGVYMAYRNKFKPFQTPTNTLTHT